MNYILIIFFTFHFEAAPAETTITFSTAALCEKAKANFIAAAQTEHDRHGWGRPAIVATCVQGE